MSVNTGVKPDIKDGYAPIGKLYVDAQNKKHETVELRELQQEFNKDYMDNLEKAAILGKKRHPDAKEYFVVVLMKRERLMIKVLRNYFITRVTCPTPAYDQTVYTFNPKTENLKFLWVIPSKDICERIYSNKYSLNHVHDQLMPYVVDFMEGKLHLKGFRLNSKIYKRNL